MGIKKVEKDSSLDVEINLQDMSNENESGSKLFGVEDKTETKEYVKPSFESEEEDEKLVPLSEVNKMISEMKRELLKELSVQQKIETGKATVKRDDNYVQDLVDDWLETPKMFFAYSVGFSICADKKRGIETLPPNGKISFQKLIRTVRKSSKGDRTISISAVKSNSKREVEYLRNHSQFGIRFFEHIDDVINADVSWANKLVEASTQINTLSDAQIIDRCNQERLPMGTNIEEMRKQLIDHIAKKNLAREQAYIEKRTKQLEVDALTKREELKSNLV